MAGGSAIAVGFSTSASAKSKEDTKKQVFKIYNQKYPKHEARYVANRWSHYQKKLQNRTIDNESAFRSLTVDILEKTEEIASDIQKANQLREHGLTYNQESISQLSFKTQASTTASSWVELSRTGFTNKDCGGTAGVSCRLMDPYGLEENCTSFGYGNATALVERGGGYQPSTSGTHDIQVEYFRKGVVDPNGTASITVFAQEINNSSTEYTEVTDRGDTGGSTVTKTVQFDLDADTDGYKIGLRLQGSVTGIGKELVSDYYAGKRGVELSSIKIRKS